MSREYPCVYYKNGTCTEDSEPGYVSPCVMGPCSKETPSNADRIRAMSGEELAFWLCKTFSGCYDGTCPGAALCNDTDDQANGLIKWLKQPAEEV